MKCKHCGKTLIHDKPFMVTIDLKHLQTGYSGMMKIPVCDQKCAQAYMETVKDMLMFNTIKIGQVS